MFQIFNSLRRGSGVLALTGAVAAAGSCAPAISTQEEVQLGRQYAAEINQQLPIVEDAAVNGYVNQLGTRIASRASPRDIPYTFYVVNSDVVNAFAIPGGFVYVNRGLIEETDNLSELAGVLGHEIGHVVERHGIEQMQQMQNAQLGVLLGTVLLGQPSDLAAAGIQLGGGLYFASNSRGDENEADRVAVQYVTQAGINPEGIITFFEQLLREQESRPGQLAQWFSTHPLTAERIENTRSAVREIPAARLDNLIMNTQEYEQFKAQIRQLPAPPRESR